VRLVDFSTADHDAWDALCDDSPDAWLFHRSAWIDMETRRFVSANLSFALELRGEIAGLCPLYLSDGSKGTGGERLLHSGIHRHTGLALRSNLAPSEARAARSAAMNRIFELAEQEDADRIQLNAHNLAPRNLGPNRSEIPFWVEEHGFDLGLAFGPNGMVPAPGLSTCGSDQIVDLTLTKEALFTNVDDKSGRWAIRKAKSFGLSFDTGRNEQCIDEYYALAGKSATRTGESLASREYYGELWQAFAGTGRCVVHFARQEQVPIAAAVLLVDKSAASYHAGVSDPDYLRMCGNDFVLWHSILWAKQSGRDAFRFGPWFPTVDRDWAIAKVSRFKKKFGGTPRTIIQGSWFRRPERYLAAGSELLAAMCRKRDVGANADT